MGSTPITRSKRTLSCCYQQKRVLFYENAPPGQKHPAAGGDRCAWNGVDAVHKVLDESLAYEILAVVEEIPYGCVATYGQIARLIGRDKNARLVGKVLSRAEHYGAYPCHRVVNHQGRPAPGWAEQERLLVEEGVTFRANGCVDLKRHRWDCG